MSKWTRLVTCPPLSVVIGWTQWNCPNLPNCLVLFAGVRVSLPVLFAEVTCAERTEWHGWVVEAPLFCHDLIVGLLWTELCDDLVLSVLLLTQDVAQTEHPLAPSRLLKPLSQGWLVTSWSSEFDVPSRTAGHIFLLDMASFAFQNTAFPGLCPTSLSLDPPGSSSYPSPKVGPVALSLALLSCYILYHLSPTCSCGINGSYAVLSTGHSFVVLTHIFRILDWNLKLGILKNKLIPSPNPFP